MFQDPLTAVMAMLLLCFMGILVMFLFLIRSLSSQAAEVREAFRKQQMSLADMERQLMDLNFALRKKQSGDPETLSGQTAQSDSGNLTSMGQADLMSLLEAASQKKGGALRLDDQLIPPTATARPRTEEYDPAADPHLFEDSLLPDADYSSYRSRAARTGGSAGRRGASLSIKLDE